MNDENQTTTNKETSLMRRLGSLQIGNRGITLQTIDDVFRFAKAVSMSQLCPPGFNETDCFVIIQNGLEVGMSPMAALANTYVVNNRATIFGDMPLALVRQSGLLEDYDQEYIGKKYEDDYHCKISTKRKGASKPITTTYSVADAKRAELWGKVTRRNDREIKSPWITAPDRMLLFRARGFNLRDNFSDVLKGCAIAELDDRFGEPGFNEPKKAEGRVVEPNFAKPETPELAGLSDGEVGIMQTAQIPQTTRRRGRPPKQQQPVLVSEPETKPVTVPPETPPGEPTIAPSEPEAATRVNTAAKAQSPPESAPAKQTGPSGPLFEIQKRLSDQSITHEGFLLAMHDFGMVECERAEISAGIISLSDIEEKFLKVALADWQTVLANLPEI